MADIKVVTRNRKAQHDYHLERTFSAGIVLQGSEIKSIRSNNINLRDGFVQERDGELWLIGVHISPYEQGLMFGHTDPMRPRKLLLHKREIAQLISQSRERGYTIIPTSVFLERGRAKVEIALAKGKKEYDKRDSISKRDSDREIRRALKRKLPVMTKLPSSIREINLLPDGEKRAVYQTLLPEWLYTAFRIDRGTLMVDGSPVVNFRCPNGSRAVEISVKRLITDTDPIVYLNMVDTFNNQLLVLLLVVNDLDSPRYNIDFDEHGNRTQLGTTGRNIVAEEMAMKAGLAPGQIRKGLRAFSQSVPLLETFVANMGHDLFLIEPLAYHNAWFFERHGFNYMRGYKEMCRIDTEFRPGGELHKKLSSASVFRQEDCWKTVRGRSWAIHDGILGHPFTGFQMYKRVGIHAGICTFPDATW